MCSHFVINILSTVPWPGMGARSRSLEFISASCGSSGNWLIQWESPGLLSWSTFIQACCVFPWSLCSPQNSAPKISCTKICFCPQRGQVGKTSVNARNMGIIQSRMENGKQNSSTLSSAKNMPIQGQGFYSMGCTWVCWFCFGGVCTSK